ncbi:HDOD domain-containing protein [Fusibacter paucivorans]|uniref:Stage 0 sporulation protein A homolog n=1 Tax=Fusibacter paucivorans TaxID=76009 RepID=A0ABS5PTR6_9FIRM|nr:HDOD domain-containing protein [Fusibacter paucivorans]MBS7527751.1 HDOD domain-containing protein [Fusibacter paucivorans]
MRTILFVDDEVNILRAIRRMFRNAGYECYYASNIEEAVQVLIGAENLDMLVTDIKMPNFDGIRLLKLFKEATPTTIRVALSGYASTASITEAISKNLAKQYFFKPWDNNDFLENIQKVFALEDKFVQMGLFQAIQDFERIKTFPKLFDRVNQLVQKDAGIEDICHVIEEDMAMTSNILRIANSAFYAAKTGDLQQAIMYIGLNNLKQLILSYEIATMNDRKYVKANALWHHAVTSNLIFHDLYERFYKRKVPPIIGSAGLLHDLGAIIMLQIYGTDYYRKLIQPKLSEEDLVREEENYFKMNHAVVGGYFLNWWAFPMDLVEMALYHHDPREEGIIHREEVALMCIASHMAKDEIRFMRPSVFDALDILHIKEDFLKPTYEKFQDEIMGWHDE